MKYKETALLIVIILFIECVFHDVFDLFIDIDTVK